MGAQVSPTGGFYRDDAARLVSDAARTQFDEAPQSPPAIPTILLPEPNRPPLAPAPARNQNRQALPQPGWRRALKIAAWIAILPFYLTVWGLSVVVLVEFARQLLHIH